MYSLKPVDINALKISASFTETLTKKLHLFYDSSTNKGVLVLKKSTLLDQGPVWSPLLPLGRLQATFNVHTGTLSDQDSTRNYYF